MKLTQRSSPGAEWPTGVNWPSPYPTRFPNQFKTRFLLAAASLMVACATAPTGVGQARPVGAAQSRFTAAVAECQRQHTYTVSEAVRENEPISGADRTLNACMEQARTELQLETGQAQR
jgi:hypothetical protein